MCDDESENGVGGVVLERVATLAAGLAERLSELRASSRWASL